ncbi:hypothetical protein CAPTEDRAFT_148849 [Capitella teleta]|uniref:Uncharacterized protein n=1 Tax=Capitella teleta TaxID=283909 RepID=R7UCG6_CAPTE|nr:hypothetical protein CAPTEDRAFT_148849 [Capitella teleta]|eukprot:ELU01463.1 hypothetical protein CAPTEDRAFT_148849 [Capitella teleta]
MSQRVLVVLPSREILDFVEFKTCVFYDGIKPQGKLFLALAHPRFAFLLVQQLRVSQNFRSNFPIDFNLCLFLAWPQYLPIDYAWDYRIRCIIEKTAVLDDAMNWLNTLGGGYSALGDYSDSHSESAARIALRQWKIASELGNDPIVVRCYLYMSLSLMQRGYLRTSKYILRCQYYRAQHLPIVDRCLFAMCQGLWSRLKHLYLLRKISRSSS